MQRAPFHIWISRALVNGLPRDVYPFPNLDVVEKSVWAFTTYLIYRCTIPKKHHVRVAIALTARATLEIARDPSRMHIEEVVRVFAPALAIVRGSKAVREQRSGIRKVRVATGLLALEEEVRRLEGLKLP